MTPIGPGLFWTLFGYFLLSGTLGLIFELADYRPKTRTYVISILITFGFAVWLGVARW